MSFIKIDLIHDTDIHFVEEKQRVFFKRSHLLPVIPVSMFLFVQNKHDPQHSAYEMKSCSIKL